MQVYQDASSDGRRIITSSGVCEDGDVGVDVEKFGRNSAPRHVLAPF
jgi:hypothetical protein